MRKSGLRLEQEILRALADGEASLRELETRLGTNHNTVRAHCSVLEFFGLIGLTRHARSDANGRPFTTAQLTPLGRKVVHERDLLRLVK